MQKHLLRIACLSLASLAATSFSARAQETESKAQDALRMSANRAIESTTAAQSARTAALNERITHMNEVRPLELQNLDSANVVRDISHSLQFIEYLKSYLSFSDSLSRAMEDTLFVVKEAMPPGVEERALVAFGESYAMDRKAFDAYIATLSKLYSEVFDVLGFLQHANYRVGKKGLEFSLPDDVTQYKKLMNVIDATSLELKQASEESRKATALANKRIAEMNAAQNPNAKVKSSKKKPATK